MKVIGIIKNDHITGIQYGVIEIADAVAEYPKKETAKHKKTKNKKHSSTKSVLSKVPNTEKGTKTANKTTKTKYRIHTTITLSYHYHPTRKPANLDKKHFQKAKTLFQKKQRINKIALQNIMQNLIDIVPLDIVALGKNNQR